MTRGDLLTKQYFRLSYSLGLTKTAITELADAYAKAQTKMTELAKSGVLERLGLSLVDLENVKTTAEAFGLVSEKMGLEDGWENSPNAGLIAQEYGSNMAPVLSYVRAKERLQALLDKVSTNTTPRYSNPSSKSKSDTDKNKPDYKDPTDAIINRINSQAEAIEKQKELLDHQMDMIDAEEDYAKAVELTNKAIDNQLAEITARQKAQKELSAEAQKIRNKYASTNTDLFFDANGEFTEAYYAKYNSFKTKDSQEAFETDMEGLQKLKQAWLDHYDEIMAAEKELFNYRKDLQEMYYDHVKNLVDELERYAKIAEDEADDEKKRYDYLIAKEQALLDIRKAQYAAENNLYAARREAEKALTTSKIGTEYLDEDTRRLIYNEDDYELEIEKINEIYGYIDGLTADYINQINSLSDTETYKAEEITAQYERRVALKEKELEILKTEIDLQKKQDNLNNILAEKNIRQIVDGKWTWTYDTDKARQAAEEVADLESELEQKKAERDQLRHTNAMEEQIGQYELQKSAIDQRIDALNEEIEDLSDAIDLLENPITDFNTIITQLKDKGVTELNEAVDAVVAAFNRITGSGSGGSGGSGGSSSWGVKSSLTGTDAVVHQMKTNSMLWHVSDSATQEDLHSTNVGLADSIGAKYNPSDGKYYKDNKPLYDNGGILKGLGGIKATEKDEAILSPGLTAKMLDPETNRLFDTAVGNFEMLLNPDFMKPLSELVPDYSRINNTVLPSVYNQNNTNSGQSIIINQVDVHSPSDVDDFVQKLTNIVKTKVIR